MTQCTTLPPLDTGLKMVFHLAKARGGRDFGDYVTSGYIGLLRAHKSFNPNKGCTFTTHAYRKINGTILDQMRNERGRSAKRGADAHHVGDIGYQFVSVRPLYDPVAEADAVEFLGRDCTERQRTIMRLLADGYNNADIAKKLKCSDGTVGNEIRRIRKTLQDAQRAKEGAI